MRAATRKENRTRLGATYVVVLMASLIVSTMALASVETMRWYSRDLNEDRSAHLVHLAAQSALDAIPASLAADPDWRTTRVNNEQRNFLSLNGVDLTYRLVDSDGNLADDDLDVTDLIVTARLGSASESWQCSMKPMGPALDCLNYATAAAANTVLDPGAMISSDGTLGSNGNMTVDTSANVTADVALQGALSGSVYGSTTALTDPIAFPSDSAFDSYTNLGSQIPLGNLAGGSGSYQIDGHLLSATTNSINASVAASGVYTIDCEGGSLEISNSRLNCTLVVLNCSLCRISGKVFWEANTPNYPILMVRGALQLDTSQSPLEESDVGRNLNPPGTPYRGISDSTSSTVYPSHLKGLMFSSSSIEVDTVGFTSGRCRIFGPLISNSNFTVKGRLFSVFRDVYSLDPPPGFMSATSLRIVPGSVRRVANP